MDRAIVHLDADAFFASVEQASDARLRGRPIAVGGERHGIIAAPEEMEAMIRVGAFDEFGKTRTAQF